MASLHLDNRSGNWVVCFRWAGKQYRKSCRTGHRSAADAVKARIEETLRLLELGRLAIPSNADTGTWIMSDGKVSKRTPAVHDVATIGAACKAYFRDQIDKADTTLTVEAVHLDHLKRVLQSSTALSTLTLERMQSYIHKRMTEGNRMGGLVSGTTVRKELRTFTQLWDWARQRGYVASHCPIKDPARSRTWAVKIPKPADDARFLTVTEINRQVSRGGLSDDEKKNLWRHLFLDDQQIKELLEYVERIAPHSFIHPMFAFVAYTGMRRSEMCRSRIEDIMFDDDLVIIRERKRRKDRASTTRQVPLHPRLKSILSAYLLQHPGGQHTIAVPLQMPARKSRDAFRMITPAAAYHHFRQTLKGDETWDDVRGFHVLRHSFGAICTRAGVPMNVIAKWMGHTTEEMMRLYQHLFPQDEQKWMARIPA